MRQIDLNCDMGESFGSYSFGSDHELISFISSANIACGFHAGDPTTMKKTVRLALEHSVKIGAHPGFDDVKGFGRRTISITPEEAYDIVLYQIGALNGFVTAEGGSLHHVKPHGALYNMAAVNKKLAEAIAKAIYKINRELILYGLSGSELIVAGEKYGLKTANEVFADRTYQADGTLTPRNDKVSIINDETTAVEQVLKMLKTNKVMTTEGKEIPIQADTICIHGDSEHAVRFAKKIYYALQEHNINIKAV